MTIYSHVRISYQDGDTRIVPLAEYLEMEDHALARAQAVFVTRREAIAMVATRRRQREGRRGQ